MSGTYGDETIYAGLGDDRIRPGGGSDTVFGGEGNDLVIIDRSSNRMDVSSIDLQSDFVELWTTTMETS